MNEEKAAAIRQVYEDLREFIRNDVRSTGRLQAAEVQAAKKLISQLEMKYWATAKESIYTAMRRETDYGELAGGERGGDDQTEV